ncbi:DUF4249 domain-containing protein [Geofilum rubicundum]|uniref:DUF4249 domain-containing protein n=1 Tax=Geofilum rubicundum JCM 15548 TaxID=1236989 RepID=A0A0E9M144_9BACT|nr:DUF4249 domain-containing protein [Geofilum rubicundum]GAO31219.1 hypothetical protein JCM15548_13566 [Geofilum rubicundum JCM 15548]
MIKRLKFFIILPFLGVLLESCETDLPLKLQEGGGQMVLFAFPTADSTLSVHLSKSVSHSSVDDFERIYNGYVAIYKNGARIDSFAWPFNKTWEQRPGMALKEGDLIQVVGGDSEGLRVTGKTAIPEAVFIEAINNVSTSVVGNNGNFLYDVLFKDPPGIDNFYQLIVTDETRDSLQKVIDFQPVNYSKDDEVFYIRDQEGSLLGGINFLGSFSDYLIQGKTHRLRIGIPKTYLDPSGDNEKRILRFHLMSLSEDYFNYLRSRVVAEYNYDLPVVDPIKIHSNIDHGLGLVGGISIASDSIVIIGNSYE